MKPPFFLGERGGFCLGSGFTPPSPPPSRGRPGGGWVHDDSLRVHGLGNRCYSPLTGASLSSCFAKKKVSKEEGDPGSAPGCARSPARLGPGGGCATRRCAAQTVLALFPPGPALLGTSQGARHTDRSVEGDGRLERSFENATLVGVPMWSAEQRRGAGGSRRGLFEPRSGEFRSRPDPRAAQGSRRSRPRNLGSPFLWLLSFGEAKESTPAGKAEHHACKSKEQQKAGFPPPRTTVRNKFMRTTRAVVVRKRGAVLVVFVRE